MGKRKLKRQIKKRVKTINIIVMLIALLVVAFFSPQIASTARYIYNEIHENILSSKDFYFSSDKLAKEPTEYKLTNNWSGAETYHITVNLSSKKNDMAMTESDITYTVTYTCSNNIECTFSKLSGTVVGHGNSGTNADYFIIDIDPLNGNTLSNTEQAWVNVVVTSTSPYTEVLSGKLIVQVGSSNLYYEIADTANTPYLMVNIINSSPQNADVTLTYDPTVVLLDMTSHFYLDATDSDTEVVNTYYYLNSITSNVNLLSTTSVKFYKVDPTQNYSYAPGDNITPIISMTH